MNNIFNRISITSLEGEIELATDQNGIAISDNFSPDKYLMNREGPYFVEEITIIRVHSGTTKIRINLNEYSVSPNSIIILTPNYIAEIIEYSKDFGSDLLLFDYNVMVDLPLAKNMGDFGLLFNQQPVLELNSSDFNDLSSFYTLFKYHCNSAEDYQKEITKNIFYALCYQIVKLYSSKISIDRKSANRSDILYKDFFSLLFAHYKSERTVQFYAEKLNITPKYFSKVIKETSKRNASDIIDEMVINGIKATLKCSNQTVLQISEEFNFPNASFFGTYFKKRTGYTPHQYRNI